MKKNVDNRDAYLLNSWAIAFLFLFIFGCNSEMECKKKPSESKRKSKNCTVLNSFYIGRNRAIDFEFTDIPKSEMPIFTDVSYISLSDSLGIISEIQKVLFVNDKIIIHDSGYNTESVFFFDGAGRGIKRIKARAKGSGELMGIARVFLSPHTDQVVIVDTLTDRYFYYDTNGIFQFTKINPLPKKSINKLNKSDSSKVYWDYIEQNNNSFVFYETSNSAFLYEKENFNRSIYLLDKQTNMVYKHNGKSLFDYPVRLIYNGEKPEAVYNDCYVTAIQGYNIAKFSAGKMYGLYENNASMRNCVIEYNNYELETIMTSSSRIVNPVLMFFKFYFDCTH